MGEIVPNSQVTLENQVLGSNLDPTTSVTQVTTCSWVSIWTKSYFLSLNLGHVSGCGLETEGGVIPLGGGHSLGYVLIIWSLYETHSCSVSRRLHMISPNVICGALEGINQAIIRAKSPIAFGGSGSGKTLTHRVCDKKTKIGPMRW